MPRGACVSHDAGRDAGVLGPRAGDAAQLGSQAVKAPPSRRAFPHTTGAPAMPRDVFYGQRNDPPASAPQRWIGDPCNRGCLKWSVHRGRRGGDLQHLRAERRTSGATRGPVDYASMRRRIGAPWVRLGPGVPRALGFPRETERPPKLVRAEADGVGTAACPGPTKEHGR